MTFAPVQFSLHTVHARDPVSKVNTALKLLYSTRKGTMPLARDFGINLTFLDRPSQVAQSLMTAELVEQTARFIPQARVDSVTFQPSEDGLMIPKVVITLV